MEYIEAEFDNGVLRPLRPVGLHPGEHVSLLIVRRADPGRWDLARLAQGSKDDAQLAEEGLADWATALDREDQR